LTGLRHSSSAAVVDNPYSGEIVCKIPYISSKEADSAVSKAAKCQKEWWFGTTLDQRIALCKKFMKEFEASSEQIAKDISKMMGKPIKQARGEIKTTLDRAQWMINLAPEALAEHVIPTEKGERKITREPVGVVVVIAPWNYPLLTAVNAIVPAILAGNSVLLKHSSRTPLCADHFQRAFEKAGAPASLVTALHASHGGIEQVLARPEVGYCHFTGSVSGGHQIYSSAAKRFIEAGLELGGKDPAYVAQDANLEHAAENLVDGGCYNAGQSCCGIERVYVHRSLYKDFLDKCIPHMKAYALDDPLKESTTMGPMATPSAVPFLAQQVKEAKEKGARVLYGGGPTKDAAGKGRFFQPTLVADCTHDMSIMKEESFGPIVAVQAVDSDEQAVELMNDSPYGLTAAVWSNNQERAHRIAKRLETGTVFMNRCDFLDPQLAWTGVKDTGKGVSLSKFGFGPLTRLKSYNFRTL
jgi:acyl-CoA reductase-like NAD-dependent aldehyde dehydrogenase